MRIERGQGRGARDVRNPRSRLHAGGDLGNRGIRDAEEYEVGRVVVHFEPALAQPCGDGRADAARTDHMDRLEHKSSSSLADTGHREAYRLPPRPKDPGRLELL